VNGLAKLEPAYLPQSPFPDGTHESWNALSASPAPDSELQIR